jgi:hypothetical protein
MTEPAPSDSTDAEARAARLDCLRCGSRIEPAGSREFRTGGSTGAVHLLIGQWAELGEGKLTLELFVCPVCRHVELRAPA